METIHSATARLHSEMQQSVFNDVNEIGTSKKDKYKKKLKKLLKRNPKALDSSRATSRNVYGDTPLKK